MNCLKVFALMLAYLAVAMAGRDDNSIAGGEEAEPHSIPFQAYLEIVLDGDISIYACAASILDAKSAITTAMCCSTVDASSSKVNLVAGSHDLALVEETRQTSKVIKSFTHPKFDTTNRPIHDVCIIKLETPLQFNEYIQPVPLPTIPKKEYTGDAQVSGWGTLGGTVEVIDNYSTLQKVVAPIVDDATCEELYSMIINDVGEAITNCMMCSGEIDKGACMRDNGSPLLCEGHLCGIASWGVGSCNDDVFAPYVFTQVNYFLDWIKEKME